MPLKPEDRRKPGGYLSRMNADNIADEMDELKGWIDKMARASSPEQRLEIYTEATGCLWRMKSEMDELKDILKNGKAKQGG